MVNNPQTRGFTGLPKVILIAGPTASGKSALSLNLAERFDGEVINADSMQVYDCLQVLTARPSLAEMQGVPHHLYGFVPPDESYSVARWCDDAMAAAENILARGKSVLLVGGTGLYFKALLEGLSAVPPIDSSIRTEVRNHLAQNGVRSLYELLLAEDPVMADRLHAADQQRIARALEVVRSTGRSLSAWQNDPVDAPIDRLIGEQSAAGIEVSRLVLLPDRDWLYARCNLRFQLMIEHGALDEVAQVSSLDEALPAMRALGVSQLLAYSRGECSLEDAVEKAQTATRQYAKRQMTWLRNQFSDWNVINEKESERIIASAYNIIIEN
jgi:tRNA dimethylallyltransferase